MYQDETHYPFDHTEVRKLNQSQLFRLIDDWLNCNSRTDYKEFSGMLNSTHRTLQQLLVGFFFKVLVQYGRDHCHENDAMDFDPRNQDAVMLCRNLAKQVDDGELKDYFRFI